MSTRPTRVFALWIIFALALAVRLWWVLPFGGAVEWFDFDNYARMAAALSGGTDGWRWTLDAVRYDEFFKAPLYQVALSVFTAWPDGFPLSALLAQAVLDSLMCVPLFVLGTHLHSRRAGLVAAGVHALWIPAIRSMSFLWQEQLFVPLLVTGLAMLSGCLVEERRPARWAMAGAVLGLAALTRSALMYYVLPVALVYAALGRDGRTLRQAAALTGGFAALIAPYALALSLQVGRPVIVEDIGFFQLTRTNGGPSTAGVVLDSKAVGRAPAISEVVAYWMRRLAREPGEFVGERIDLVRLLVKPSSGPWLMNTSVESVGTARVVKWLVHVSTDLPLLVLFVLAPLALALARRTDVAVLLAAWLVLYVAMLAMTNWAGARFREPIEPLVIVLAAAVIVGGWRRIRRLSMSIGGLTSAAVVALMGVSLPAVVAVSPNYGVTSGPVGPAPADIDLAFPIGVNVQSAGLLALEFRAAPDRTAAPARIRIIINGDVVDELLVAPGGVRRASYPVPPGIAYLECEVLTIERTAGVRLRVPAVAGGATGP